MPKSRFIIIGLIFLAFAGVRADEHYVAQNGQNPVPPYSSWATAATYIQDAVSAASANDTVWVGPGTYTAPAVPVNYLGNNAVYIDKLLTLRSSSGNPSDTIIDGGGVNRGIAVRYPNNSANSFLLAGFTVRNCSSSKGGGVLLDSGNYTWAATVQNCIIENNVSSGNGGGIGTAENYTSSFSLTISNCTIQDNQASITAGLGGGIMAHVGEGGLNLSNSLVKDNSAYYGGGLRISYGTNIIQNCRFTGNHAARHGGGVSSYGADTFRNCILDSNICDQVGTNKGGGGIGYGSGTSLDMSTCTLVGNTPSGLTVQTTDASVRNTIIYFNSSADVTVNSGTITYSHVCTTTQKSGTGNITDNPAFADFANGDYYLTASSPCINTGEDEAWMSGATDYNGNPRLNGTVDMGAYEYRTQPYLVQNGQSNMEIVISPTPARMVTWAAQELQEYLFKITNVQVPIVSSKNPNVALHIYVGRSSETDLLGIWDSNLPYGAFRIVSGTNWLVLLGDDSDFIPPLTTDWNDQTTGHTWIHPLSSSSLSRHYNTANDVWAFDKRGSLNAVHEYLRSLGVRWYYPGNLGEVVPQLANIQLPRINWTVHPDFPARNMKMYYNDFQNASLDMLKWQMRLGLNNGEELKGLGPQVHGINYVHGRDEVKQAHPEYFALYSGVRATTPGYGYPCLSSSGLFNDNVEYAQALFDIFDEPMVCVWPADGYMICQCSLCAGLDTPERGDHGTLSDYVLDYVNRVASELYQTDPLRMVNCGAYGHYLMPPLQITTFSPNVAITLCQWRSDFHDSAVKQTYQNLVTDWLAKLPSGEIYIMDYYLHSYRPNFIGVPVYFPHVISENLAFLKGKSLGEYIEVYNNFIPNNDPWDAMASNHLNIYVTARLWWNADLDVDDMLEEYYELYYGPAAAEMQTFIEYCETNWPTMRSPEGVSMIDQAVALLNSASQAAGTGTYGQRVGLVATYMERLIDYRNQFGDRYVAQNGQTPVPPYNSWATAATSIQDAVNATQEGYTVWVGPGTYTAPAVPVNYLGNNAVYLDKLMTLRSSSGNPADTIIDGGGVNRGIAVRFPYDSTKSFVLDGFTVRNCSSSKGGGVLLDSGNYTWAATVQNCIIENNVSSGNGGGIGTAENYTSSFSLTVSNCTVQNNQASITAGLGGGIMAHVGEGGLNLSNSLVKDNSAYYGGGLRISYGTNIIQNCRFTGNHAARHGGGVSSYGADTFRNCILDNNICDQVGTNKGGGGIGYGSGTSLDMSTCTLVGNTPSGLTVQTTDASVRNTIIYFNSGSDVTVNSGSITYSHVCTTTQKSGTGNITGDPFFTDYAGKNFHLTSSSPCINTGEYESWMDTATDYAGNPRLNGTVDMGAYEYQ